MTDPVEQWAAERLKKIDELIELENDCWEPAKIYRRGLEEWKREHEALTALLSRSQVATRYRGAEVAYSAQVHRGHGGARFPRFDSPVVRELRDAVAAFIEVFPEPA